MTFKNKPGVTVRGECRERRRKSSIAVMEEDGNELRQGVGNSKVWL